mgnify:CR=1 FL=1
MIDNSEKFNGGKTGLVEQEILRQIDLGNFRRNSLLPSERELAKQLGVSYMTVRRAIGKLVDDSFLTRVQGKGTYVRGDVPLHRMQQTLGIVVPAWETPEHADLMMILTAIAGENGVLPKFHLCPARGRTGRSSMRMRAATTCCSCRRRRSRIFRRRCWSVSGPERRRSSCSGSTQRRTASIR